MSRFRISAEGLVSAPAAVAYAVIADYREGHPRILPRPPFISLDVEHGGIGAGTIIRCQLKVLGRLRTFRAAISEPEPGRVLVETHLDSETVSTFTVESVGDGARVVIATEVPSRGGPLGWLERFLVKRALEPVYAREIELLGEVAGEEAKKRVGP